MDYISSFLALIVAFILGMFLMAKIIYYRIRNKLKEAGMDIEAEENAGVIAVKKYFVENINEVLYLYEHETNSFIAQGKTLDELAQLAKENSKVAVVSYNKEVVWFDDGKVKTSI
jgi:hypothetical protein